MEILKQICMTIWDQPIGLGRIPFQVEGRAGLEHEEFDIKMNFEFQ